MLFRINAQSQVYEAALADVGVPYVLKGGERFFERPEVREAVLLLRGRGRRRQRARRAGAHGPRRAGLDRLGRAPAARRRRGPRPLAVARRAGRPRRRPGRRRTRRSTCPASSGTWPSAPTPSTRRPCRASPSRRCTRPRAWSGTSSSSSGLVDGVVPIAQSLSRPEAVEEERRLLYVAVTRAREQLTLSWSLARNPGAKRARPRSRFLTGLAPDSGRPRPPPAGRPRGRRSCSRARRGSCSSGCGRGAARPPSRQSVPAYVVFTDATLQAIAETRPANLRELSGLPGHRRPQARALRRGRARDPRLTPVLIVGSVPRRRRAVPGRRDSVRRNSPLIRLTAAPRAPYCPGTHELHPSDPGRPARTEHREEGHR